MNNATILVQIHTAPQLRYTSNDQTPIAEFMATVPPLKDGDGDSVIQCSVWGNNATQAQTALTENTFVILSGSLRMDVVDRPEGFKEKAATFNVSGWTIIDAKDWPQSGPTAEAKPIPNANTGVYDSSADYSEIPF
jgi:single-stranded DNA-binding protein